MNITELARILKITPQELHDKLPLLGFDIGQKAIKINASEANKIIRDWPRLKKKLEYEERLKQEALLKEKSVAPEERKKLKIPKFITVRDLAAMAEKPVNAVLAELMKNGIFASLNEKIDYDTAWLVGSELGFDVELDETAGGEKKNGEKDKLKSLFEKEKKEDLLPRPPVIVVMGHVDHGKTKLLDAIRTADVAAGEAGGITQHIGAYQINRKGKKITFIDTPGHEAFTAMRSRGAKIADIAILVVAADDGVKPQTVEAFRIIEAAHISMIVAINKIDKPEADINKTKQELSSQLNIIPEDWGGKTICAPVSAVAKTGIEDLLDMILLTADLENEKITANPNADAVGTIIESRVDKGAGPVATILVQNGTLKLGDNLSFDGLNYGKVRALSDYQGKTVEKAEPSAPAKILGLRMLPEVGDILEVGLGKKIKHKRAGGRDQKSFAVRTEEEKDSSSVRRINIIIKSDVLGSAEAIGESLEKISGVKVKVNVIHKGLGNITDGDIKRAGASDAQIFGFNVKTPPQAEEMAREKNITIKNFKIIYDLINDVKAQMESITEPEYKRIGIGKLKVAAVFRAEDKSQIVGGRVIEGRAEKDAGVEIIRNGEFVDSGKLIKLRSGKEDVTSVEEGQECGIQYEGKPLIQPGDVLNFWKEEKI